MRKKDEKHRVVRVGISFENPVFQRLKEIAETYYQGNRSKACNEIMKWGLRNYRRKANLRKFEGGQEQF